MVQVSQIFLPKSNTEGKQRKNIFYRNYLYLVLPSINISDQLKIDFSCQKKKNLICKKIKVLKIMFRKSKQLELTSKSGKRDSQNFQIKIKCF